MGMALEALHQGNRASELCISPFRSGIAAVAVGKYIGGLPFGIFLAIPAVTADVSKIVVDHDRKHRRHLSGEATVAESSTVNIMDAATEVYDLISKFGALKNENVLTEEEYNGIKMGLLNLRRDIRSNTDRQLSQCQLQWSKKLLDALVALGKARDDIPEEFEEEKQVLLLISVERST